MDRILNMVIRRVVGRIVNRGVDAGINAVTRRGQGDVPADHARGNAAARNMKGALRMTRRIGRL